MITKKAFTLIELMIAITIVVILTMSAYAPYNFYQNKAKLKVSAREVWQVLYEARNMAINWAVWTSWNVSIWVYFSTELSEFNEIKIFSYPYDMDTLNISFTESPEIKLIKTLKLRDWIKIDDVDWKTNLLFFYDSITWKITYYNWNSGIKNQVDKSIIPIKISYKWSTSPSLNKTINYFTNTNIIDY